jgi:hypothetical protein
MTDNIDLWHFVHGVVSDSRRRLNSADTALWGIFAMHDGPEKQRRYDRAEREARAVYETLRDYFEVVDRRSSTAETDATERTQGPS